MITSIAGVTIVINTLTCTLIIRYLLYAPCMGKGLPSFRRGRGRLFPFGGVGGGFLFPITKSQSQNHKKDFQCVKKGFLYNIIPY